MRETEGNRERERENRKKRKKRNAVIHTEETSLVSQIVRLKVVR